MIKNRFLLIPIIIIIVAFLIDKLLLMEGIQTYFSKTMSEVNYFHKPHLFNELKEYLQKKDRKKVLVYFGSSRGLLFDNKYIKKHYPEWTLFNFSVPGGTPDYFYFWLEQFKEEDVKPEFVLLDNSIEAYNLDASIKIDEVLVNGLTISFVLRYFNKYTAEEVTNFIAKRMFRTYQYRPNLKTVLKRMKNDFEILRVYQGWRNKIRVRLIEERGSASSELSRNASSPDDVIKKFAEGNFKSYMSPFHFNKNMLFFLEGSVKILQEMKIPHSIIWVSIAPHYVKLIKTKTVNISGTKNKKGKVYDIWMSNLKPLYQKLDVQFWNMNEDPEYNCNKFTDASHMSSDCYPAYTDYIFKNIGVEKK